MEPSSLLSGLVLAAVMLPACASADLHQQLDDVEHQIANENARLDAVRTETAASEQRAAEARRQANFQECRATEASVKADMSIQLATCQEETAKFSECRAQNSAHTATAGVGGCLLGIGIAAVSAGVGAGAALAGCGAGLAVGDLTTRTCAHVACSTDPNVILRNALATHHLTAFPLCWGTLRVTLASQPLQPPRVGTVEAGGPAALAGIGPADVIVAVAGAPTPTTAALVQVLQGHAPGETVDIQFARADQVLRASLHLAPHP